MALSRQEAARYARQLVLRGFGGPAQQALKQARVLMVGAGGLGAPAIAYLAGAGVGTLGVVDDDTVGLSNLHRQVIFATSDTGRGKAEAARDFAARLNPHVALTVHPVRLGADNAKALLAPYDLVVEGSDNMACRRAVAEAARALGKPMVSGAVSMVSGQVTTLLPGPASPTLDDLYGGAAGEGEQDCAALGVLGPVTGVIGTLMAMEAIKLVTGMGEPLVGRVLIYDGRDSRFTELGYGASG
jgi:molybdopterin/thiamine biosynthesis adenylyltransferase